MTFKVWDGTQELGASFGLGPTEGPVTVGMVPGGAWSTDRLVAIDDFVIAHRVGSLDWAEGTQRGATESVLRSVDALEIPVSRSSDGVWFSLHDQTLLRTSGVDIDPSTLTWHQIQDYLCAAPVGGDPAFGAQPYARLVDLLDAYAESHVIFIDPKYHSGAQWRDEFFGLIQATVPNAQKHVVIKYTGGGTSLADDATARGFRSWGYFYQDEYVANPSLVMANAAHWTYLGLDISAPQGTWDVLMATGKPVIGHIAQTLVMYQTAISKGAAGVMCSGIRAIKGSAVI